MLFVCSESATRSSQKSMFIVIKRAPLCSLVITLLLSLFLRKKTKYSFLCRLSFPGEKTLQQFFTGDQNRFLYHFPPSCSHTPTPYPRPPTLLLLKKIQSALFKWQRCIQKTGKHGAHHIPEDCCIFMSLLHVTSRFLGFFSWTV